MAGERYVIMTIECTHCKTKQKLHVNAHSGAAQMANHSIKCISCAQHFIVTMPDEIVGGPFPA